MSWGQSRASANPVSMRPAKSSPLFSTPSKATARERRDVSLHAKTGVIDGVWSTVGSSNIDFWSFLHDDEVNAVILSCEFAAQMEQMFNTDIDKSDQVKLMNGIKDHCILG